MARDFPRDRPLGEPPALAEWRRQAAELGREVLAADTDSRTRLVLELALLDAWSVTLALLEAARLQVDLHPHLAASLCRLAILAAENLGSETGRASRPRVLVCAWCHLGDALRRCGRLPEADRSFARAYTFLATISGDREALVIYLSLLARLRRDQGRLGASRHLLDQACALGETEPGAFE
jgi:hypothetical protein